MATPRRKPQYTESFIGDESLLDLSQYGTPLKKLTTNSVPDVWKGHDKIKLEIRSPTIPTFTPTSAPVAAQPENVQTVHQLTPISDVAFRLHQTKLMIDSHKQHSHRTAIDGDNTGDGLKRGPIYYKPPSSIQSGVKTFLPPTFIKPRSNTSMEESLQSRPSWLNARKNAYMLAGGDSLGGKTLGKDVVVDDELVDDNDDVHIDEPTGEWYNPVVKIALLRQINKEKEFSRVSHNVIYIILFSILVEVWKRLVLLYLTHKLPFQNPYVYYPKDVKVSPVYSFYGTIFVKIVGLLFITNILYGSYKLFKKQDQCTDLPLTNKQREMLGLTKITGKDPLDRDQIEDERADLASKERKFKQKYNSFNKPRYTKTGLYTYGEEMPIVAVPTPHSPLDSHMNLGNIELTYSQPAGKTLHPMKKYQPDEVEKLNNKFKGTYSIDFNISDDE